MKYRFIILATILTVGLGLRLHAISPYLFYPDSYQSLMVAHNLATFHSAVGTLGPGGLVYPDFFAWTRPLYPALIALGSLATDPVTAAHAINLLAGLGAVVLAYALLARLFGRVTGLIGAAMIAASYGSVVWSGFVFTESIGNFMVLLVLWQLFRHRGAPAELADPQDLVTGALLAAATLTRYEYALLVVPALFIASPTFSWRRAVNILVVYALTIAAVFAIIRPFAFGPSDALHQIASFGPLLLISAAAIILAMRTLRHERTQRIAALAVVGLTLAAAAIIESTTFPALKDFATSDWLISHTAALGLLLMAWRRPTRAIAVYLTVSATLLAAAYFHTNPAMGRYGAHLLPFLLIPAAYITGVLVRAATNLRPVLRTAFYIIFISIFVIASIATFHGLRFSHNGIWYRSGYEFRAAQIIQPRLPRDAMLVVSMPEPYFFVCHAPTQSLTDIPPFLHLGDLPDDARLAIVQDAGMELYFPHFARILDTHLQPYLKFETKVGEPFRYRSNIQPETKPLRLYITDWKTLRSYLK